MDKGPFRAQRPADRRVVEKPEPVVERRQAFVDAPADDEPLRTNDREQLRGQEPVQPTRTRRSTSVYDEPDEQPLRRHKKSFKLFRLPVIGLLVAGLVLGVLGSLLAGMLFGGAGIDGGKYQAVFFTNGQVYFGKLAVVGGGSLKLTDVFYLQTESSTDDSGSLQEASSDQNNVQLIKLGSEIHGPEDEMIISKEQVLFYENLKTDGKVAQSIDQYKQANE